LSNTNTTITPIQERPIANVNTNDAKNTSASLNILLSNEYGLFTKTLNYHWNVVGPRFHSLHELFESQYKDLLDVMDDVAERVRILGENPFGTVSKLNETMELSEKNGGKLSSDTMISDLFNDNISIQTEIKKILSSEDIKNDPSTEDFLISLLQKHEMMSWTLRSHLN